MEKNIDRRYIQAEDIRRGIYGRGYMKEDI